MKEITQAALRIDGQPMFWVLDRARRLEAQGQDIIHLEIGDPDFGTPHNVTDAAIESLRAGHTHYTSSYGLPELREAIRFATRRSRGFEPDLSQVLVTPGANTQIYYAVMCLVEPGMEVIVPDPGFSTYYSVIKMLGAKAVPVRLKEENQFRMDPKDIEAAITDRTRLIIINTPHNPTGSVMTQQEVRAVYDIAVDNDVYVYSDEIYARMSYGDVFYSPSVYDQCREHVILSNGFCKSFAMTGWRLGTLIGPELVVERMAALLQTVASCVQPFIQRAGIRAINGDQSEVAAMMQEYRARRDLLVAGLNSIPGFDCLTPDGAFYVFPNIKATGMTSDALAEYLLEDAGVALLPGTCFGANSEGYLRLCYANSKANIREALQRINTSMRKL
jgi:aspartate/methionine/tyrosine aminotransferase